MTNSHEQHPDNAPPIVPLPAAVMGPHPADQRQALIDRVTELGRQGVEPSQEEITELLRGLSGLVHEPFTYARSREEGPHGTDLLRVMLELAEQMGPHLEEYKVIVANGASAALVGPFIEALVNHRRREEGLSPAQLRTIAEDYYDEDAEGTLTEDQATWLLPETPKSMRESEKSRVLTVYAGFHSHEIAGRVFRLIDDAKKLMEPRDAASGTVRPGAIIDAVSFCTSPIVAKGLFRRGGRRFFSLEERRYDIESLLSSSSTGYDSGPDAPTGYDGPGGVCVTGLSILADRLQPPFDRRYYVPAVAQQAHADALLIAQVFYPLLKRSGSR